MADVADGQIVDGRYRVQRRIGSGGMADVYLADDSQLGREVALKVLHRRFARDREFVERFRREASAAAGLQHPNVVSVFDRGEYDGTYYIAMEYLPGRTLKDLIREEAPLDQQRVIGLAIQILQAAAFAHRRGVIHRDFKPHNVIVGPDDRLKVTDFGIARAGASEMTETGSIMGTAQYLSPEQAQGQRVGAPSDLYSIGIIVYEMLAGRVPFGGDSAVSIALKHVSDAPARLRDLRPDVHPRLEQAVGRALLKDPAQRYASADEFIAALEQARTAITSGENGAPGGTSTWMPPVLPDEEERDQRGARWPWIVLVLLLLGLVIAAAIWQPWSGTPQKTVPTVVGATSKKAKKVLTDAGFKVKTHGVESEEAPGRVVAQDPRGGAKVDEHSTVDLAVSSGPGRQLVPSVVNLPAHQAQRELNAVGFKVTQDVEHSTSVDDGLAIRTSPKEGTYAPKGANVRLIISSGPPPVTIPSVVGQDKDDARATLEDAGLQVTVEPADSQETKDQVLSQDPAGGTSVDQGTTVTLTISRGPQKIAVPDVVGDDVDSARGTLASAGFRVKVKEVPSDEDEGTVIGQSPDGGSRAIEGTTVTLTVAKPQDDANGGAQPPDVTPGDQGGEGDQQSTDPGVTP
jgi:beta-lactam-binding protein with PASTA domain/predicted Ser/Thr protein kinase